MNFTHRKFAASNRKVLCVAGCNAHLHRQIRYVGLGGEDPAVGTIAEIWLRINVFSSSEDLHETSHVGPWSRKIRCDRGYSAPAASAANRWSREIGPSIIEHREAIRATAAFEVRR